MSIYMIINSNEGLSYFPSNKSHHFKTKLQQTLNLQGNWRVALMEITLRERVTRRRDSLPNYNLYIYSPICGESLIDGLTAPLLRRVVVSKIENTIFNSFYYVPVVKFEINELEFVIKNNKGVFATDLEEPITLVLHFRAYPFYA